MVAVLCKEASSAFACFIAVWRAAITTCDAMSLCSSSADSMLGGVTQNEC